MRSCARPLRQNRSPRGDSRQCRALSIRRPERRARLHRRRCRGYALSKLLGEVPAITLVEIERTADPQQAKEWLRQPDARAPRRLGVIVMHADAVIPTGEHGAYGSYDFFKPSTLDERTEGTIKESVREAVVGARLSYEKLDQHDIDAIVRLEPPVTRVLTPQGKDEVAHPVLNRTIPFALLVFIIMGTYTGAGSLLSTTVEEKFNRVMEVLLSAVSPFELMAGKILGQMGVSVLVLALYLSLSLLVLSSFALAGLVQPILLLYLLIFFLATYLIVGALMGAVGAAVNDLRDAQNLLLPINLVMMLPWLLAFPSQQSGFDTERRHELRAAVEQLRDAAAPRIELAAAGVAGDREHPDQPCVRARRAVVRVEDLPHRAAVPRQAAQSRHVHPLGAGCLRAERSYGILKTSSSSFFGRSIPCSKYFSQYCAHGRPYMSGTSYSMTCPGRHRRRAPLHRDKSSAGSGCTRWGRPSRIRRAARSCG